MEKFSTITDLRKLDFLRSEKITILIESTYVRLRSAPTLELLSRATSSVGVMYRSSGPNIGSNPEEGWILKKILSSLSIIRNNQFFVTIFLSLFSFCSCFWFWLNACCLSHFIMIDFFKFGIQSQISSGIIIKWRHSNLGFFDPPLSSSFILRVSIRSAEFLHGPKRLLSQSEKSYTIWVQVPFRLKIITSATTSKYLKPPIPQSFWA